MKILINGIHFNVNDRTKAYTKEKFAKLGKYCSLLNELDVKFKSDHKNETTVEVLFDVKGKYYKISQTGEGMFAMIDKLADKLEIKLTKINDKYKEHRTKHPIGA